MPSFMMEPRPPTPQKIKNKRKMMREKMRMNPSERTRMSPRRGRVLNRRLRRY
jgi:hypothetical protein